jgi:vancomycin resistance protein YoaR
VAEPARADTGLDQATVVLPPVTERTEEVRPPAADTGDTPTEVIPVTRAEGTGGGRRRVVLIAAGAVVGVLAVLYGIDLALSSGTVPRGVTIAGQDVGGLAKPDAEQRVRTVVEPRTTRPVDVAAGGVTSRIDPRAAGLAVDWAATIDHAGTQPLNPITRIRSFFTHREVGVVSTADDDAVDTALQQLAPLVDKPPAEGTVRFEGVAPVPVPPVDGQALDVPAAHQVLERDWTSGSAVQLPVTVLPPMTDGDDVTKALTAVATPAVSGPVTVAGEKVTGAITPEVIAKALSFRADPNAGLVPELDKKVVQEALDPQMASSEQPGRDAAITFAGGRPAVTPSQDGRGIDYDATLQNLVAVLTKTGDDRRITAVYAAQPAELTTDELNGYGIKEVMGEFTTRGFAVDSGRNIKRAADVINGTIIGPGETFSLNGLTEPRDAAHGYIEAGVIQDGHASRDVGGGVSQVATTTYNAAYFAGMTDVTHKPHSFYISRYPPGREATVVGGPLDLKWRNDTAGGVLVQAVWTPATLTVRVWGTKRYDVTSTPGPRTKPTQPNKVEIPAGEPCTPSQGAPGFTITDTRTIRDLTTGAVRTERRTTKYNPAPIVACGSG